MATGGDSAGFSIEHDQLKYAATTALPGQSTALAGIRERTIASRADDASFGKVDGSSSAAAGHGKSISELEQALAAKIKHMDSVADGIGTTNSQSQSFDDNTSAELTAPKLADADVPQITGSDSSGGSAAPSSGAPPEGTSSGGSATPSSGAASDPESLPIMARNPGSTNLGEYSPPVGSGVASDAPATGVTGGPPPGTDGAAAPVDPRSQQPTLQYNAMGNGPADEEHPGVRVIQNPDGTSSIKIYPTDKSWGPLPEFPNASGEKGYGYRIDGTSWFPDDTSHGYHVDTAAGISRDAPWDVVRTEAGDQFAHAPTPWDHNTATPEGTPNNALPFGQGHVHTFVLPSTDPSKYSDTIVNYTDPDHILYPGYVLRRAMRMDDGTVMLQTYGEGRGDLQSNQLQLGWRPANFAAWSGNQVNIAGRLQQKFGYDFDPGFLP